jgi:LuxR family maltose regulon positive regulatory protein
MPLLASDIIERPRLFSLLDRASLRPVTTVSGPVGWGKTTLIASWLQGLGRNRDAAWVGLHAMDGDPVRFWPRVLHAVREVSRPGPDRLLATLHPEPSPEAPPDHRPALVAEALAELDRHLTLVLDDVHLLQGSPACTELAYLLLRLPAQVSVVLCGLFMPSELPLARLRMAAGLQGIGQNDLALTEPEAVDLFSRVGLGLPPASVRDLCQRTEGWPAALRLVALAIADGATAEAVLGDLGNHDLYLADYVMSEVLDRQVPDIQEFLLTTCVCRHLNGPLARELTGRADAGGVLTWLTRRNLFTTTVPGRPQWSRYHNVFRDLLYARLQETPGRDVRALHQRAAAWLADQDLPLDAFEHASLAQDWDLARRIISEQWLPLTLDGQLVTLRQMLDQLPATVVAGTRELSLVATLTDLSLGRRPAELPRDRPGPASEPDAASPVGAVPNVAELMVELERGRLSGDLPAVTAAAQQLLDLADGWTGTRSSDLRAFALLSLGITEYWVGAMVVAERHLRRALVEARATNREYVELGSLSQLAGVLTAQDRLDDAVSLGRTATALAEQRGWTRTAAAAELWHALGWAAYVRNELADADRYLDQAMESVRTADRGVRSTILLVKGLVASQRGEATKARAMLSEMSGALAGMRMNYVFLSYLIGEQARLLIAAGDHLAAETMVGAGPAEPGDWLHLTLARAELARERGSDDWVVPVLRRAFEEGRGFLDQRLQVGVLLACREAETHGTATAVDTMSRVVAMAEPERMLQPLLRFERAPEGLLRAVERAGGAHREFVRDVLRQLPGGDVDTTVPEPLPESAPDALTGREREVLQRLDSLDTVTEIAATLFVSVNTVKSHVQNLYLKLGVNKRRDAVRRARELGLL